MGATSAFNGFSTGYPLKTRSVAVGGFLEDGTSLRLTKMVHFFPCTKEIIASEYARLFVNQVFKLHGMLEVIISDRDP